MINFTDLVDVHSTMNEVRCSSQNTSIVVKMDEICVHIKLKLMSFLSTVKPLNGGHIGDRTLVRCREVVPTSEVDLLATPPIEGSLIGFNTEGCGLQDAESANLDQTRSERAKINKTKEWTDYLSNQCPKFDLILMICARGLGLCPLSEVILYRLLSFGGMLAVRHVRSREVSASRRLQIYYFYRKSNLGHEFCPLYGGCPPFGESVIRGFTVDGSSLVCMIAAEG